MLINVRACRGAILLDFRVGTFLEEVLIIVFWSKVSYGTLLENSTQLSSWESNVTIREYNNMPICRLRKR